MKLRRKTIGNKTNNVTVTVIKKNETAFSLKKLCKLSKQQ